MKRTYVYSDGYDGAYEGRCKKVAETGVFCHTRSVDSKSDISPSINVSLHSSDLLNVFRHCDYLTILSRGPRVCKHWNKLICDDANRKTILYRTVGRSLVEGYCEKGDFRKAQNICESADEEVEYFRNLNDLVIEKILSSIPLHDSLLGTIQDGHTDCIPCIKKVLNQQPFNGAHLGALQEHLDILTDNMLLFMDNEIHFQKGYPIIIANIFQKLISVFNETGKINIMEKFQNLLLSSNKTFVQLIQQEFPYYFNIIKTLCTDSSLEVKKEAALTAGLMAICFPSHQDDAWILFLDMLNSNSEITKYIIRILKTSQLTMQLNFPDQLSLLITSGNEFFMPCLRNNLSKFTLFLENLFSTEIPSVKTSAAITLLIIAFNEELTDPYERIVKLRSFQQSFRKNSDLFQSVLAKLDNMPLTSFKMRLQSHFLR